MDIGHPVYEMGSVDPNTTPGGIPSGSQMSIRRSSDVFPSTGAVSTPTPNVPSGDTSGSGLKIINPYSGSAGTSYDPAAMISSALQGVDLNASASAPITSSPITTGPSSDPRPGQGGGFSGFNTNLNNTGNNIIAPPVAADPILENNNAIAANADAIRIQNEIDAARAQAAANAKAQAELDAINATNAAAAGNGFNNANLIAQNNINPEANNQNINAANTFSGFNNANLIAQGNTNPEANNQNIAYGGAGGTLAGAGGAGRFSPVFGEFSPQQQYSSIMSTELPNYYMPGYQQMSQRQFQPTYGRFLLGGYGAGGTGTADQTSAEQQRQNYMQTFGDWYSQQDRTAPTGIQQGWNLASELAGMQPGSEGYYRAALGRDALPLAESLQNAEDVQAMALARYYGGATPQSSYASRQASSALGNLFNRFSNRQMQQGQTSPASFVSYLNEMSPSRFGAYA